MKQEASEDLGTRKCQDNKYQSNIFIKDKWKEEMLNSEVDMTFKNPG